MSAPAIFRKCASCGSEFVKSPKETWARWGSRRYCSTRCANSTSAADRVRPLADRLRDMQDIPVDPDACWGWLGGSCSRGYGRIGQGPGTRRVLVASRVSYEINVGPIPDGMDVCHSCDNPPCTNPKHLFLGTHTDNMRDMARKGRSHDTRGEGSPRAVLNNSAAIEIYRRSHAGEDKKSLSKEFGVSVSTVAGIYHGRRWAHITRSSGA